MLEERGGWHDEISWGEVPVRRGRVGTETARGVGCEIECTHWLKSHGRKYGNGSGESVQDCSQRSGAIVARSWWDNSFLCFLGRLLDMDCGKDLRGSTK